MNRQLLTGNAAAAWGARLANVDYIPAFPITPQTEIIETLAQWIEQKDMPGKLVTLESEHSMLTAAGAASSTGVRVFSATSSQGLLYGMEMIYNIAGWRAPMVLVNVSRGLSAPITLEPDHNDILAARDSGFLQIHCASCQEVLDSVLIAYRLAEHKNVRLPVLVNQDGFYLSFTREPVNIPDNKQAKKFVGEFDPENIQFRASTPLSHATAVLGGTAYSYFRYEMHLAAQQALHEYEQICTEFSEQFGRSYGALDEYYLDDAEFVFIMMGSFASKAKVAVDALRNTGLKIGLLRPRLFRPFPEEKLYQALQGKKAVAVIDQNLSMGKGGILHSELISALYGKADSPSIVASFIGGLGGRDISQDDFFEIAKVLQNSAKNGETPPARLLFNEDEIKQVIKLQAVAHVERNELEKENHNGSD